MKSFIEVTDQYKNEKMLLPIKNILFIRERGDARAIINFEMAVTDRECKSLFKKFADVVTLENYSDIIKKLSQYIEK